MPSYSRFRLRSTQPGYQGRPAGSVFDLEANEYAAVLREAEAKGTPPILEPVPHSEGGVPATAAALKMLALEGVDLSEVYVKRGGQITIEHAREAVRIKRGPKRGPGSPGYVEPIPADATPTPDALSA